VRLFGRKAMVDGIAVQPPQISSSVPLKDLMEQISFKPGQAYSDYQTGDKASLLSLHELITSDDPLGEKPAPISSKRPLVLILASGCAIVCFAVIGVGVWAWRKTVRSEKAMMARFHLDAPNKGDTLPSKTTVAVTPRQNGSAKEVKEVLTPASAGRQNRVNGKRNGHYGSRRKRVFNYQKFYSDLMLQVSDQAYEGSFSSRRNGEDSPKSNGNGDAAPRPAAPSSNLDLIASQMNLIEEQQRLIREQTKLIEEKTRLIHEKSQLMDKQTELFGNGIY
jgi:hypothetical protein